MSNDPAAIRAEHAWSPDGTGEGQCYCDGRWFKTKAEHEAHVEDVIANTPHFGDAGSDCGVPYPGWDVPKGGGKVASGPTSEASVAVAGGSPSCTPARSRPD